MIEEVDRNFYKIFDVSVPELCPDCRYQLRLANRNEWNFFRRKCDLCKKDVLTLYSEFFKGKVYCQPCWWSDSWDAFEYGMDFDFSRPFFEQFGELRMKVPRIAMTNPNSVNCEYTNQAGDNKNCYLLIVGNYCENCMYGNWYNNCKDCADSYMIEKSELLYEGSNCLKCFQSAYLKDCTDCNSSYFLEDCRGCQNCFGCYGLRGKNYCWFNEQLSKEEYNKRLKDFDFSRKSIEGALNKLKELGLGKPHKFYHGQNNENPSGDYLTETRNASIVFNSRDSENIRYCQDAWKSQDSLDCTEVWSEKSYQTEGCIDNGCMVVSKSWEIFNSFYSDLCFNVNDLFGCISLRKKSNCILNKQYSKEEYVKLKEKIIAHMKKTGEWGHFFPVSITTYAYNETVAQDYFPLTKEQALAQGYDWFETPKADHKPTMQPSEIPQTIKETDDSILKEVILCKTQLSEEDKKEFYNCTRAFKITPAELNLYRKLNIPIPNRCFHDRRQIRLAKRNPRKLWDRQCDCKVESHEHEGRCPNEFETSYSPDRPEIVYCEACYNLEVV